MTWLVALVAGAVLPPCAGDALAVHQQGATAELQRAFEVNLVVEALPDGLYWCSGEGPRQLTVEWLPERIVLTATTPLRTETRSVTRGPKTDPLLLAVLAGELVTDALRPGPSAPVKETPPAPVAVVSSPPTVTKVAEPTSLQVGAAVTGVLSVAGQPLIGPELFLRTQGPRWGVHAALVVPLATPVGSAPDFGAQGVLAMVRLRYRLLERDAVKVSVEAGVRGGALHAQSSLVSSWVGTLGIAAGPSVEVPLGAWRLCATALLGGNLLGVHWLREGTEFSGWHGLDGSVTLGLAYAW